MKRSTIIFVAIVIALIPLGMWWYSAEQVIKRRTQHLMDVMTISAESSAPIRQAKVFSMNGLMADQITVKSDVSEANGTFDKQELESAFSYICQNAKQSRMKILNFDKIEVDENKARVESTVECLLELPSVTAVSGTYKITIDWVNTDDGWKYQTVTGQKN